MRAKKRNLLDAREKRHYAVLIGRDGPKIYTTVKEVHGFSGACSKRFRTVEQASRWLLGKIGNLHGIIDTIPRAIPDDPASYRDVMLTPEIPNIQTPPSTPPRPQPTELPPLFPFTPPPPVAPKPEIVLSAEQRRVLDMVISGRNVFFTGPAGTGKSVLLKEILNVLREKYQKEEIAVTASTGIAALNIGGMTVHSFSGIIQGKGPLGKLIPALLKQGTSRERWRTTRVLIIDEISMINEAIFDKLEAIARALRRTTKANMKDWEETDYYLQRPGDLPFGGIQLVISGDFFQLPPVPERSIGRNLPCRFAFDAASWPSCISAPVLLSQVFRQKDQAFIDLLSSMRLGQLLPEHVTQIKALQRPLVFDDDIGPSELFPRREDVEDCNISRLNALDTPIFNYRAMDSAGWGPKCERVTPEIATELLKQSQALEFITLRVGAQVMLLRNIEQGSLVNGSIGKIVDFLTVREACQRQITSSFQPNPPEQPARFYDYKKAVSDLYPDSIPPSFMDLTPHFFAREEKWPLVKFTNGKELLCTAMTFPSEGFLGNIEALRIQVPLSLAWAMSIHKSQGQTLPRVKVDLGRVFEKGQTYVALSRATCLEGLEIHNFDPGKVQAHPRVLAWHTTWLPQASGSATRLSCGFDEDEMDSEEAIAAYMRLS